MAARLPYLDRAHVEPEIRAVYDTLQKASGRVVQLTLSVAAANFTTRVNEALGTELEFEEARHA